MITLRHLYEAILLKEAAEEDGDTGPSVDFYNKLTSPDFQSADTFPVKMPFKIDNKKVDVVVPIKLEMGNIEKEVEQYLSAPPQLKKQFDSYAYWYDNFNKLIFDNIGENDACLFLAACAFCSANTALDQNILEAAKLFTAVKTDFETPEGRKMLSELSTFLKDNMDNATLARLKPYVDRGSAYASILSPKRDYKGGTVQQGARKGQEDVFSEVTVSNAKIPNFNSFIKYYLAHNGKVTKAELMKDFSEGRFGVGGTKVGSFFMNLVAPGYRWKGKMDPATIDRWMIRVFFDKPLEKIVREDVHDWILEIVNRNPVKAGKKDTQLDLDNKKSKQLIAAEDKIINTAVMQLFGTESVRQNLVKILNTEADKMGLTSYQLQALAWVNIRVRYKEPAAKFARFEDVMHYSHEAANGIAGFDAGLGNSIVRTIKILASGPRFKFKDKQDVVDTITNRDKYENVYVLPPKNDVEEKKQQKALMAAERWGKIRIAVSEHGTSADVFDMGVSKKSPVHHITGQDRKDTLKQALSWILTYSPTIPEPKSSQPTG